MSEGKKTALTMNRAPQGRGQPRLGATWYPGGQDDFYMPEVISPSPQRCALSILDKIIYGPPLVAGGLLRWKLG